MARFKLFASIAATTLVLALSQAPSQAASPMTETFLANVAANLAILNASSRLAADHTKTEDVRAYAGSMMQETREVATALAQATPAGFAIGTASVAAANVPTARADGVVTGRSVAVAGMNGRVEPASKTSVLEAANGRMPATAELAKLQNLHGRAFDKLYFITQLDALSQIESDYRTYISQGDDPAVAMMAHEQLPALMKRLEALTRI